MKWIKGYQDEGNQPKKLTLAAQPNCKANKLAEAFNSQEYAERAVVPNIKDTAIQFDIKNQTVNGHYKQQICKAIIIPPYKEYLKDKFKWSNQEIDWLDWEAYKRIL